MELVFGGFLVIMVVGIVLFNGLVRKRNEIQNAEGGLDAQLKQRYDLVPNLVSAVKKFMRHETQLLENIVNLRNCGLGKDLSQEEKQTINSKLSRELRSLMVQVEQYPELRSGQSFVHLQETLYEIEENIAASRRFFNTAVTIYNNATETYPSNVVARLCGFKRREVFEIPEIERQNPDLMKMLG